MPSLNFPNNPSLNQVYTANDTSWRWNGSSWVRTNTGIQGTQGVQGTQGTQGVQGTQGDTYWENTVSGIHTTVNVGISTTTADSSYALDVHGDTRISGILTGNVGYLGGQLEVAGIATFQNNVFINGALVAGSGGGGASIGDDIVTRNLYASGVSTFVGAISGSSASFTGDVTVGGELRYEDVTNVDSVGIATARSGLRVTGGGLDVVGVATFNNGIDTLDVIGHAELDQLRVSGVSTFTGNIDANGDLDVENNTELNTVNVSGASTFVGVGTFQDDLFVAGALDVDGNINFNGQLFQDNSPFISSYWIQNSAGIHTLGSVGVGTTSPSGSFEVAGHTELDDVNVSGVSTFVGIVTSQSDVFVGNDLSVAGDARVVGVLTVGSSSITIDGNTNTINVGTGATIHTTTVSVNQLEVAGLSTFAGIATFQNNVFAQQLNVTELVVEGGASLGEDVTTRNLSASGIATISGIGTFQDDLFVAGALDVDGNVNFNGQLFQNNAPFIASYWVQTGAGIHTLGSVGIGTTNPVGSLEVSGHTELDQINVSGVSTFQDNVSVAGTFGVTGLSYFRDRIEVKSTSDSDRISLSSDALTFNGSGDLTIKNNTTTGHIILNTKTSTLANFFQGGAVELYYNNSKKFETTTGGVDITGHTELDNARISGVLTATSAEFSGNVTVLGDLTYENVVNVDAIGIATARAGLRVTGGGLDVVGVSTFNDGVNVSSGNVYQINGVDIISATTLGAGITASSLRSVAPQVISDRVELTSGQPDPGDYILLYDTTDGQLKKSTISNAALQGVQGIQGVQGTQGIQGVQGTQGTQGVQGTQGIQGVQGTQGIQGVQGTQGIQGVQGTQGIQGIQGIQGTFGTQGTQGIQGILGNIFWEESAAGISTTTSVGVNTVTLNDADLVGVGNSFQGIYISNGMIIHDNVLSGNHYIGTAFNGLMAGPVDVQGSLTIDGAWVVV